jgi:hypothetical protein
MILVVSGSWHRKVQKLARHGDLTNNWSRLSCLYTSTLDIKLFSRLLQWSFHLKPICRLWIGCYQATITFSLLPNSTWGAMCPLLNQHHYYYISEEIVPLMSMMKGNHLWSPKETPRDKWTRASSNHVMTCCSSSFRECTFVPVD